MKRGWSGLPPSTEPARFPQASQSSAGRVYTCTDLSVGDDVEARFNGTTSYQGQVTDIAEHLNVFWMEETTAGGRKLVDFLHFHIYRLQKPRPDF